MWIAVSGRCPCEHGWEFDTVIKGEIYYVSKARFVLTFEKEGGGANIAYNVLTKKIFTRSPLASRFPKHMGYVVVRNGCKAKFQNFTTYVLAGNLRQDMTLKSVYLQITGCGIHVKWAPEKEMDAVIPKLFSPHQDPL
ncbi:unnamed protein product [Cylicocyclus nassatus]|uniref:Uncharacterized protein n=1 Tax=Cylicocyclus nassatus TaxID=53992 RepID=A0AA36GUG6_CYLNA|nr:unnamed protein product [Cylicocyclus nassatus]